MDDTQLYDAQIGGLYDLFVWGWTPYVDPDPMLSYFTCDQVTYDVDEAGYNDANWCDPAYDELYQQQKVELDPAKRREIVAEMLTAVQHRVDLSRAAPGRRPAGISHRPVRGLAAPAGRDRTGAVHELVTDLREPQP